MYSFTDKSENLVVLRPEGTAVCMRWLLNQSDIINKIEKEPIKLWYHGPMFRYERPQAGRMRQFYQLGIEHIGGSLNHGDPGARPDFGHMIQTDFEIIDSAIQCLDQIYEHKLPFQVQLNNLGSKSTLEEYNKCLLNFFGQHKDFLSADSKRRVQ